MAVTHQTFDTYLFADCVAWNESILACGTYQLHEESKTRKGGVLIYELNEDKLTTTTIHRTKWQSALCI